MKRTCDQLGACQSRTPACPGCLPRPAFAPGVIEHHKRQHTRELIRQMSRAAVLLIVVVCASAYLEGWSL